MSKREPGLDLLRCIAFLFVVTFHSFLNNGYYSQPQVGVAMWLAGSVRWLSVSCIGLFLMLTGYLKSEKTDIKVCYASLLPILLGYLLASMFSIPVRHFILGDVQSLSTWIQRLVSFRGVFYGWYIEMYIGLTFMMPFINRLLSQLYRKKALLTLCIVMLILTALPGATPLEISPDHWRSLYPLTYYILGAAVKHSQPKIRSSWGLIGALVISLSLGAATVLSTDEALSNALTWEFADLWIVMITVYLFVALYNVRICPLLARFLRFCASGCFGGYMLSHLLDAWCYRRIPQWHTPQKYPLLFLCATTPIFFTSILSGKLLQTFTNRLLHYKKEASKCLH